MRGGTGHWHELAKLLPILNTAGFDSLLVEQEAGVERATQNKWTVSMHVSPPSMARLMPLTSSDMPSLAFSWILDVPQVPGIPG